MQNRVICHESRDVRLVKTFCPTSNLLKQIECRKMKKLFNSLSASVIENSLSPDQAWRFLQTFRIKIRPINQIGPDLDPNCDPLLIFLTNARWGGFMV